MKSTISKFIHCIQFQLSCFNTFHFVDYVFLNYKFTILINFSLYILWIKIDKFSPWQCLVFCLISNKKRANKHKLHLVFNTKSTSYQINKSAKNIQEKHSRKPELFWNIAIVWYMALSKFSDIIF